MTPKDVLDLKEASKYLGMDEASLKLLASDQLFTLPSHSVIDLRPSQA